VTEEILKTYGLTKDFGGVRAVNNLNFTLEKGVSSGLMVLVKLLSLT